MKNVTSKDPRKPRIVHALKKKSGGNKVTLLKEISPGVFQGHCMKPERIKEGGFFLSTGKSESLGNFTVTAEEAGLEIV